MVLFAKKPQYRSLRLYSFVYGSSLILFLCLVIGAYVFSETYLKKEQARASDSAELITRFFESHHQGITEELSTKTYESIAIRVAEIAKKLGRADYDLVVVNNQKKCVLTRSNSILPASPKTCVVPESLVVHFPEFESPGINPLLQFDYQSGRYLYMAPVYVGEDLKGYLYVSLSDPYDFYQSNTLGLVVKFFALPILCILAVFVLWLVIAFRFILKPYLNRAVELEKKQAVAELAGQVAHNIRSPLVVVNSVVRNIRGVEPSQRKLLISAASRIEKIANQLISQFTSQETSLDSGTSCFLVPVIESIIAEKVAVLGSKSKIEISAHVPEQLSSSVVPIPSDELGAIFSNLINNSTDALAKIGNVGRIDLIVESISEKAIQILIRDNGPGIPPDILSKLVKEGGSYGKTNGSGIGLPHAREVVAQVGGKLLMTSKLGKGTDVKLEIPLISLPAWCPQKLDLTQMKKVIVLDDDPSVHLLWQERLAAINASYFTDPDKIDFASDTPDTFYILDYEICESSVTGLDLIVQHQLGNRSVLVTSYFNEPEIQEGVQSAGSWMLPKFMIHRIEISVNAEAVPSKRLFDLVLIDDDLMIQELWTTEGDRIGKKVKAVKTLEELSLDDIDPQTPFFVDKNLSGISGLTIAKTLYIKGFKNISITTGDKPGSFVPPKFVQKVTGKRFPVN